MPLPRPQASYTLTLELSEADSNFDDKIDILEINGLQQATEFVLRADAAPDEGLLPLLRLLSLQGAVGRPGRSPRRAALLLLCPPACAAHTTIFAALASVELGARYSEQRQPRRRATDRQLTRTPCSAPLVAGAGADAFLLESIFRSEAWEHMQLPVSEENERACYQVGGAPVAPGGHAAHLPAGGVI